MDQHVQHQHQRRALAFICSLVGITAIIIEMVKSVEHSMTDHGRTLALALNVYFSYFTTIMNIVVALSLLSLSVFPNSRLSNWLRQSVISAAICLYILIVGIIFYTLLVGTWDPQGIEFFATHAMHAFMPSMFFYLWFTRYRNSDLKYTDVWKWIWVPLVYFIYLMIRGQIVHLYPYFFVDVDKYGLGTVLVYAVAILAFFALVGAGLVTIDRRFSKK